MARQTKVVRRAFNAGEISRNAKWRNDLEKHSMACEELENFYVSPLGYISRRNGTIKLGEFTGADNLRLIPFEYSRENSRILAFYSASGTAAALYTAESKPFTISSPCSICLTIPSGTFSGLEIFKKGNLRVELSGTNLAVFVGAESVGANATVADGDKVVIVCRADYYSIYRNGESSPAAEDGGAFADDGGACVVKSPDRSLLGLKILPFDMAQAAASDYYSLSDYQAGRDENLSLRRRPSISFSQDVLTGATLERGQDGVMYFNPNDEPKTVVSGEVCGVCFSSEDADSQVPPESANLRLGIVFKTESLIDVGEDGLRSTLSGLNTDAFIDLEVFGTTTGGDTYWSGIKKTLSAEFDSRRGYAISEYDTGAIYLNGSSVSREGGYNYYAIWANAEAYWYWGADIGLADVGESLTPEIGVRDAFAEADEITVDALDEYPEAGTVSFSCAVSMPGGFDLHVESGLSSNRINSATFNGGAVVSGIQHLTSDLSTNLAFTLKRNTGEKYPSQGAISLGGLDIYSTYSPVLRGVSWAFKSNKLAKCAVYSVEGVLLATLDSPIPESAIGSFQFKQVGAYVYFAHADMKPCRLVARASEFYFEDAVGIEPSKTLKIDGLSLSLAGDGSVYYKGDIATIDAASSYFTDAMIGRQLKIDYTDSARHTYEWRYNSTGATSAVFPSIGTVKVRPEGGVWDGVLILEESTDGGLTWGEIGRTTSIQGSSNEAFDREVYDVNSVVRAKMLEQRRVEESSSTTVDSATEGCKFNILRNAESSVWVEIVAVNSATQAVVKFLNPCRKGFVSNSVYESAWGGGYPRCVELHEERLCFAGNREYPSTIWLSQTNNWDNFRAVSNLDTDPLSYTLASDDGEPISWLVSRQDLMIGLGNCEWSLGSRDAGQALTASIVQASSQSDDGAEYIMPARAGGMVVYVRRGARELGAISYDFASDSYNSMSLTTMHPEILGGGVKCIFNQLSPSNKIYALRNDGVLAVFTYDKENNVAAWGRFTFGSGAISACAASTGKFKSLFLAVSRGGHVYFERLDPNEMNNGIWEDATVLDSLSSGVAFTSRVKTMPMFVEGNVKVFSATFYLFGSLGGKFRVSGFNCEDEAKTSEWRKFDLRESEIFYPQKRDFRYRAQVECAPLEECSFEIETDEAAPFNLIAIATKAQGL